MKTISNKPKILFITEAMGGGVFTYLVDLANGLVDDYEMYIAYSVRQQTPQNYREYFDQRIHLIEVENFTRSVRLTKDLRAFFEIRRIAKEVQPDLIHLHSSKAGVLGRLAFCGKKIPLFYTPHGYSFLMKNHSALKRTLYKSIEKICGKRHCTTISCSKGEYEESLKLTKQVVYINNGINLAEMDRELSSIRVNDERPFTVFTLGRICHQKNPKLFLEIAAALPDVRFLWIGDGELRGELIADNIEITGWKERKEALAIAYSADVFLLTSLWEGLPISLLEAMYMRKPCIVSDVIGNHDVIHNGENGYVCTEISEYVNAIREVQAGRAKKLVKNAYQNILEKYNTEVMVKKYSDIYTESLKSVGGGYQPNKYLIPIILCPMEDESIVDMRMAS